MNLNQDIYWFESYLVMAVICLSISTFIVFLHICLVIFTQ